MAERQNFGIKFPITNNDDERYIDLNSTYIEEKQSELIHLMLTRKGSKLRDPNFGCGLMNYIFDQSDEITEESLKNEIMESVERYIPNLTFIGFEILMEENDPERKILSVDFSVNLGNFTKKNNVKVRI